MTCRRTIGRFFCYIDMGKLVTKEIFQKTIDTLQEGKYQILGEYVDAHTLTQFKCLECNLEFDQSPNHLKTRRTCPCKVKNTKSDFDKIESDIEEKFDGRYTLEKSTYVSGHKKMKMFCKEHGEFFASPYSIISGRKIGCEVCSTTQFISKVRKTTEEFIEEAISIHGGKYDYSKVNYTTAHDNVEIICPIHGSFSQIPNNHLKRIGCPKCGSIRTGIAKANDFDEVIEQFKKVHKNRYSYPNQDYTNNKEKIKILCPKHGEFLQSTAGHLRGQNCPKCALKISKAQMEIMEFIESFGIVTEESTRKIIPPHEVDIWLPEYNVGIEYHGLIFHREGLTGGFGRMKPNDYHLNKTQQVEAIGGRLIQVFEDEWLYKEDIIKNILKGILGKNDSIKVSIDTCKITAITKESSDEFLEKHNIFGADNSTHQYGIINGGKLLAVMTFSNFPQWQLDTYCVDYSKIVIGGVQELFEFFLKQNHPKTVTTVTDKRFSNKSKNVFLNLGFSYIGDTEPQYHWINLKSNVRVRYNDTQYDLMLHDSDTQWDKIWDCGGYEYKLEL